MIWREALNVGLGIWLQIISFIFVATGTIIEKLGTLIKQSGEYFLEHSFRLTDI